MFSPTRRYSPDRDSQLDTLFLTPKAAERAATDHIAAKRLTDARVYIRRQMDNVTGQCIRGYVVHIKPKDRNGYNLAGV